MTREEIKILDAKLRHGDKRLIARMAGLAFNTVGMFFSGKAPVSDETSSMIIETAAQIIKNRNKLNAASERILKSLQSQSHERN
jgi:hypothetical protein